MANCRKCGTKLEDFFEYCPECGTKIIEENVANIYEADMKKMKKYGIYNPSLDVPTILVGIIVTFFSIPFIPFIVGIFFLIRGLGCIFHSKKYARGSMIRKQTRQIKIGMDIQQIRAMFVFMEPNKEGFTRNGDYILNYSTENRKHSDYESVTIYFDKNAKVIDHSVGYRRTTTYYT